MEEKGAAAAAAADLRHRTDPGGARRSQHVVAVYHSHFGQGCYLSADDLAFASHPLFPFPDADQIVVSLLHGKVQEVGVFEPRADASGRFIGRRLEAV